MPNLISIIDYKAGNLGSVANAIKHLGYNVEISTDIPRILDSDGIILPGVGAFGDCMENLRLSGYIENKLFDKIVKRNIPFFGICIGLQLLFEESEEMGTHEGLGLIKGTVLRFPQKFKCPQIGWNSIMIRDPECVLFNGIEDGSYFYFVHSYFGSCVDSSNIIAETNYSGLNFASMIRKGNIFASQFHPEKSGKVGLKILKNFLEYTKK